MPHGDSDAPYTAYSSSGFAAVGAFASTLLAQVLTYTRDRIHSFIEGVQLIIAPPKFRAPLSSYAASKIEDKSLGWKVACAMITFFGLFCLLVILITGAYPMVDALVFAGKAACFVWLVGLTGTPWRHLAILRLKMANEADFLTSQQVSAVLEGLTRPVSHYKLTEKPFPGNWKPIRVLHQFGATLRGQMGGDALQVGGILPNVIDGTINGAIISDLLDSSTVLLVTDDRDETMRVLLPSARFARETIRGILKAFVGTQAPNTHTHQTITSLTLPVDYVELPLSHIDVIDRMDAMIAANKPLSERPTLNFVGRQLLPGVLVATGMVVGEVLHTVLPTGYFHALVDDLSPHLGVPESLTLHAQAAISA